MRKYNLSMIVVAIAAFTIYCRNTSTLDDLALALNTMNLSQPKDYEELFSNILTISNLENNTGADELQKLLDEGAPVDYILSSTKDTPLYRAAQYNATNLVAVLLANGANTEIKDYQGITPLYKAIENYADESIDKLLAAGAKTNTKNSQGMTPLHLAAQKDYYEIIEKLIKKGANINEQDDNKKTPLHYAAQMKNIKSLNLLLKKGAALEIKDKNGNTPLLLAIINTRSKKNQTKGLEVIKILIDRGAKITAEELQNLNLDPTMISTILTYMLEYMQKNQK